MNSSTLRGRSVRSLLLAGAASAGTLLLALPANAQQQQQAQEQPETVIVTGSMLPQLSLTTPAPVEVLSAVDIEATGLTNTTDLLRSLAANNSGSLPNSFGDAFASGSSNISLRGLFSNSTLVLINGQRTVDYPLSDDGTRSFVDLNTIPEHAIDHVEILKDGASSIYGADAVAGVVNIILKNSFEGIEADGQWGDSELGGGQTEHAGATIGYGNLDTDHFNVFLDLEWEHDNDIHVGQRAYPFNQEPLFANFNLAPIYGGQNTSGGPGAESFGPALSATVAPVLINDFTNNFTPTTQLGPSQPIAGTCGFGSTLGTNNPLNPFGGTYCYENNGLKMLDQPQQDRYNAYVHGTAKLWGSATFTMDASYNESDVYNSSFPQQPQASTPVNTSELSLPAYLSNGNANPNDPFVFGNPLCAQTGQSEQAAHSATCPDASVATILPMHTGIATQSHVLRTSAVLNDTQWGWNYTLTALAAHSWLYDTSYGFVSLPVELADVNNGTYNFVNPLANSQTVMNNLAPPITTVNTNDLELFDAHAYHDLFDLPGGPVSLGVGATARHEQTFAPDSNPNLQQGFGFAQTIGERNVYSAYTEVQAPILPTLEADIAGRFDHYTDAGDTVNPKFGAKWSPLDQIAVRGTYSTGFVAPSFAQSSPSSISQGFQSPFTINGVGVGGPGACPTAYVNFIQSHGGTVNSSCLASGGDAYINSPYSLGSETTGNPDVKPIKSRSYTAGTVITPFDDIDFSTTIDYYWIQERGIIWNPSSNAAVADYLAGAPLPTGVALQFDGPDPLHPNAPLRPINVIGMYQNQNKIDTAGVDLEVKAGTDLPFLPVTIHWATDLNVTNILTFTTWWNGQPKTDWVGTMAPTFDNAGSGTPKYQGVWSNTFSYEALSTTFTTYYHSSLYQSIADVGFDACFNPFSPVPVGNGNCRAKNTTDIDWTVRYQLTDRIQLNGTIRDLLGTKPPLNPLGAGPAMNDGQAVDQEELVGRFFEIGIKYKT